MTYTNSIITLNVRIHIALQGYCVVVKSLDNETISVGTQKMVECG